MAAQRNQRNQAQNQPLRINNNDMFGQITKFSGALDENFLAFVDKFDEVTRATRTPYDQKINLLPLFLDEYAHSTFKSLPQHIRENYDRTIAELTNKFVRPDTYVQTLMSRVQFPKETISTYAHSLRMLGTQCYPNMDYDTLNGMLRGIFLSGIHHKYKIYLALNTPRTFDDAINAAQKIDIQLGGGPSLANTGFASTTVEQPVQMSILRNEMEAQIEAQVKAKMAIQMQAQVDAQEARMEAQLEVLRKEMRAKEGSSAAIGSQQSTQNPQFNLQFDSYQHQPSSAFATKSLLSTTKLRWVQVLSRK